jgi:hypothetical protein
LEKEKYGQADGAAENRGSLRAFLGQQCEGEPTEKDPGGESGDVQAPRPHGLDLGAIAGSGPLAG